MAAHDDSPGVRVPPPVYFVLLLIIAWALGHFVLPLPLPGGPARLWAGIGLVVLAFALAGWAIGLFRRAGTQLPPHRPASALVVAGPYRWSRNPIYVALLTLMAGIGLALGMGWALVALVPFWALLRYAVIAREEAYLARRFEQGYAAYCARVRRWL